DMTKAGVGIRDFGFGRAPAVMPLIGVIACSLLIPSAGWAQGYLTLRQAVSMATEHDSRIVEADAKQLSAVREAAVSHARFGPNLFTGAGGVYTNGYPQTPGGGPASVLNLAYPQPPFDGPARGHKRAADQRVEVQRLAMAQVRNQVIVETASAYLELASVRHTLERQRTVRESAQRIIDVTVARLKEARVLPVEVLQAR